MAEYAIDFEILISRSLFLEKENTTINSNTFTNLADIYNISLDETRSLLISLCIKTALIEEKYYVNLMKFKNSLLKEIQENSNSKNKIIECIDYFREINYL